MPTSQLRRARGERGAALVEFAIVLPLLVILVFGTIDIGRAYMAWNQVKGAAREGAAYAQFFPQRALAGASCPNPDNVAFKARNEGDGGSGNYVVVTSRASTSLGCGTASPPVVPGELIEVEVSVPFDILTPIAGRIVGDPVTIRASVEVVVQG